MRRRFGRRRPKQEGPGPIDERWLARAADALPMEALESAQPAAVPDSVARIGTGEVEGGTWLVSVHPTSGVAALLGALAAADADRELAEIVAASTTWDDAARKLAGSVMGVGRAIRIVTLPGDGDAPAPAGERLAIPVPIDRLADQFADSATRDQFSAAVLALSGLAVKHEGAVRSRGAVLELVIAAQVMAELRADGQRAVLEIREPSRSLHPLASERLSETMDRLEGQVRKRANDRKVRDGEEGLRGRLATALAADQRVRGFRRWPLAGSLRESFDGIGVTEDGTPAWIGAREELGLDGLVGLLATALAAEALVPQLVAGATPPVGFGDRARILLATQKLAPGARAALSRLTLPVRLFEARSAEGPFAAVDLRAPAPALAPREVDAAAPREPEREAAARDAADREVDATDGAEDERTGGADAGAADEGDSGDRPKRRRRRRGGRGRGDSRGDADSGLDADTDSGEGRPAAAAVAAGAAANEGFEEMSLFDLDDADTDEGGGGSGRRRRRKGRGGEGRDDDSASREDDDDEGGSQRKKGRGRRRRGRGGDSEAKAAAASDRDGDDDDAGDDDDDDLLQLSPDAPDLDEAEMPAYEDDEGEEPETEQDRIRNEREKRRRARARALPAAETASGATEAKSTGGGAKPLPKGRAAILAHADRESITAAVLLAREVRQIEGIWIYPQDDLMTFFRGVATDLRENTPIYVIGFTAKPARDALQAAALYAGRLVWFDHHPWPPEDLGELRSSLGAEHTHVRPGGHSALPVVLSECTRRSRFSDKLVDLVTGRFTQHDFQRWGRVWWWRLGELAKKTGDQRNELEMLLAGRPSDLAKEAARAEVPPPPDELAWVAGRDFRLVHFGGIAMVAADVPPELDVHMAMRIARERYGAVLSLARVEGGDIFVLGADDVTGKRAVDVGGMVEHLAEKFAWIDGLDDEDHVACIRARGADTNPDRFEELIAEIGMGRTILEG